jgi:hypothetical protein
MPSAFPIGTVGYLLNVMRGVWHDRLEVCALDGQPLDSDPHGRVGGSSPFENLVYLDFDGENYRQTNVTFRGRPLHVRSFTGVLKEGVLHFDKLGPDDPGHIGVAAGHDTLMFIPGQITDALKRYSEPDFIRLNGVSERTRTTVLYRGGIAVRTLNVRGCKLSPDPTPRLTFDPRGADGDVHEIRSATKVFEQPSPLTPLPQGEGNCYHVKGRKGFQYGCG